MKRILLILLLLFSLFLTGCFAPDAGSSDDPIFLEFESQTWQLTCAGGTHFVACHLYAEEGNHG